MSKYREEIESNINGVNEYIHRQLKIDHSSGVYQSHYEKG